MGEVQNESFRKKEEKRKGEIGVVFFIFFSFSIELYALISFMLCSIWPIMTNLLEKLQPKMNM